MDTTVSTSRLETHPGAKGPVHVTAQTAPHPPGQSPTCLSCGPEHLQPQLGGPGELLGAKLGCSEEGLPAQVQAGERHHLRAGGCSAPQTPTPRQPHPGPPHDPNPLQLRGEGATRWGFTPRKTVTQDEKSGQNHLSTGPPPCFVKTPTHTQREGSGALRARSDAGEGPLLLSAVVGFLQRLYWAHRTLVRPRRKSLVLDTAAR